MQQSIVYLDALVWILTFVQGLLDVLCYKYRHLAKYYIYLHILSLIITRMLPNTQNDVFENTPI